MGAVCLVGAAVENLPGVKLPLAPLHLWQDWKMFAPPGPPVLVFVVGRPRGGGEPVVLDDPLARPEGLLARVRDAREGKAHELLAKATVPLAVRQRFLAGFCARVGAQYERVEMRSMAGPVRPAAGLLIAERPCE